MSKKVELISSDEVRFEVDEMFVMESGVVKSWIEYGCVGVLDLRITSNILSMVIDFCNKHVHTDEIEDLKEFDSEFFKQDYTTLIDLICAACYLEIKSLLHMTCKTVVDMITGKTTKEILEIFNIKNDLTLDEMERAHILYPWAFK